MTMTKDALQENTTKKREAEHLENKGLNYYKLSRLPEAYENFQKAKALYEKSGEKEKQYILLRYMGDVKENLGDPSKAIELYCQSKKGFEEIGDFEKMSETSYRLGTCLYREGKEDEAIAEYQYAADKGSKNPNIYNNMGFLKIKQGKLSEAEQDCRQACEFAGEDQVTLNLALNNIGVANYLSGNYQKAREALMKADGKGQGQNKNERTIQYIVYANEKYRELTDKKYNIFDEVSTAAGIKLNLAATLMMLGETNDALEAVKKAAELDGVMAYIQIPSAWIYLAAGETEKAINTFKNAMLSAPEHKEYIEQIVKRLNPYAFIKVERNEECPCGSGKKFKKCHGR